MRLSGTQECQKKIESLLKQGPTGLMRLRELLPLIFDSHGVFTREGQMELLKACSLQPVQQAIPFHQVTFAPHPLELQGGVQEEELSVSLQQPSGPRMRERRTGRPA